MLTSIPFEEKIAALLTFFGRPIVILPLLLIAISSCFSRRAHPSVPSNLPWIGKTTNGFLAETRAHFASFNRVREWLTEGYACYSKHGRTYIFPDFSGRPEVILPRRDIQWLIEQPDSVLSVAELHYDILAGPYAFTHPHILKDPYHEHVVHRSLARKVGGLLMEIWDELGNAIDDSWGTDTVEWKELCVFDSMMTVIARASNRVFVGLPLCRDEAYLKSMESFAGDIITTTMLLRFIPRVLEPLFGHLFALPNHWHQRQSSKMVMPLIRERLAHIEKKDADSSYDWEEPNDYLSWHIRMAQKEGNQLELKPEMIARRLLPINFGAIHTTVFTITNCFFDLLSTPSSVPASNISPHVRPIDVIREEAIREYTAGNGEWSKPSLARLTNSDSALRECMRVTNVLTRGLLRKVVAKDGIQSKREGWILPTGTYVGMDVYSVMHDPEIYAEPHKYDPFRFARAREGKNEDLRLRLDGKFLEMEDGTDRIIGGRTRSDSAVDSKSDGEASVDTDIEKRADQGVSSQRLTMSATSSSFLPFGHGRHACPGRFLVSHELKMLLAYVSMNYEFQQLDERPENTWFGINVIPPVKAKIRVRRRKPEDVRL